MKQNYTNNNNETAMFTLIDILRRRNREQSSSRTFIGLFTLSYKKQGKAGNGVL